MHGDGPKRIYLTAKGPGLATAGMIETGADVEVMDPDLVICTIDDGASIRMEIVVENGKGSVQARVNRREDAPLGGMPVDGSARPGRQVSSKVWNSGIRQIGKAQ